MRTYDREISDATKDAWCYATEYFTTEKDNKSILLMGPVGTGKTEFFKQVRSEFYTKEGNFVSPDATGMKNKYFQIVDAQDIVDKFNEVGNGYHQYFTYHPLVIDDIGSEFEGVHYGNKISPIQDIIMRRYKLGLPTHFTTNLNKEELASKYGDRIMDRLREMCVVKVLDGESLRK